MIRNSTLFVVCTETFPTLCPQNAPSIPNKKHSFTKNNEVVKCNRSKLFEENNRQNALIK